MWWTTKEVAKLLGLHVRHVQRLCHARVLRSRLKVTYHYHPSMPYPHKRSRLWISSKALQDYIEAQERLSEAKREGRVRRCPACGGPVVVRRPARRKGEGRGGPRAESGTGQGESAGEA